MNKTYWQWKSTIIDFDTISNEKADFGDYLTKKEMIFQYLGCPDKEIHEWYNGGYSCEYNYALKYAKELKLVEDYIDYDDELYEKDKEIERLNNIINELEKDLNSDDWTSVNGVVAVQILKHRLKELKGNTNE